MDHLMSSFSVIILTLTVVIIVIIMAIDTDYRSPQNNETIYVFLSETRILGFVCLCTVGVISPFFRQPLKASGMRSEKFSLFSSRAASLSVGSHLTQEHLRKLRTKCASVHRFVDLYANTLQIA